MTQPQQQPLPPIEFTGVPAGVDIPDRLLRDVIAAGRCQDCNPTSYRIRYVDGADAVTVQAWRLDTTHDTTCPGLWLAEQRFIAGGGE